MEGRFSGVVKLSNVSDFISASQDCVVAKSEAEQIPKNVTQERVKISLQDCLACSGCVTSAETALLENQSSDEFLRKITQKGITVAVTISSQARAALSVAFCLPPLQLMRCLVGFFRSLGVDFIFDLNTAEDLTLIAAGREFLDRYQMAKNAESLPLNLLASSCPGWVCYVEKTHGEWCLPYLAETRSAQATMGMIIKSHWCETKNREPNQVYHCTIMSCFDKKLEAARSQFLSSDGVTPEVDACLTSTEVVSLIETHLPEGESIEDYGKRDDIYLDTLDGGKDPCHVLHGVPGRSGGLMEYIFRKAAREIFKKELPPGPLPTKTRRNANFQEITLEGEDGQLPLRFASVYGFRNIQALVQKIKRHQCVYDYVEVMACPSGCLNGGGQHKGRYTDGAEFLQLVQQAHEKDVIMRDPETNLRLSNLPHLRLATEYTKIEKSVNRMAMDW